MALDAARAKRRLAQSAFGLRRHAQQLVQQYTPICSVDYSALIYVVIVVDGYHRWGTSDPRPRPGCVRRSWGCSLRTICISKHISVATALMARKAPAMRSIGIDRDQRALDRFRPGGTGAWLCARVPGQLRVPGYGTGLQRPAVSACDPPVGPAVPLRVYRCRPRNPSRSAQEPAVPGDGLGTPFGSV